MNPVRQQLIDTAARAPFRVKSAKGEPKPTTSIERTCRNCGASFLGLAYGKTGEVGIWHQMGWWCSIECAPAALVRSLGDNK